MPSWRGRDAHGPPPLDPWVWRAGGTPGARRRRGGYPRAPPFRPPQPRAPPQGAGRRRHVAAGAGQLAALLGGGDHPGEVRGCVSGAVFCVACGPLRRCGTGAAPRGVLRGAPPRPYRVFPARVWTAAAGRGPRAPSLACPLPASASSQLSLLPLPGWCGPRAWGGAGAPAGTDSARRRPAAARRWPPRSSSGGASCPRRWACWWWRWWALTWSPGVPAQHAGMLLLCWELQPQGLRCTAWRSCRLLAGFRRLTLLSLPCSAPPAYAHLFPWLGRLSLPPLLPFLPPAGAVPSWGA